MAHLRDATEVLRYQVIGLAMEVHRELGPGLGEVLYHRELADRLRNSGIEHEFKPRGHLIHRGSVADEFEADLIVARGLIPELKALDGQFAPDHYTQLLCYLKFWRIRTGFLMDFCKESLVWKKVVHRLDGPPPVASEDLAAAAPNGVASDAAVQAVCGTIAQIYAEHGLGYRDTTYRGLVLADLAADRVPHAISPVVNVPGSMGEARQAKLTCITIDKSCVLIVRALNEAIRAADRAVMQTYLRLLELPVGLIANFGKRELQIRFVTSPGN